MSPGMQDAFVGIDVAFAKRKRLPVVISTWRGERLVPLPLRGLSIQPPRGRGNPGTLEPSVVRTFAEETADYLHDVCARFGLVPRRIALDAPSAPRSEDATRRAAERALDQARISCFTTPSASELRTIGDKARRHLDDGGAVSRMPHANQLWMIVGFELFRRLERLAPCIEVFPQATVRAIGAGDRHKFRSGAVEEQLSAAARHTGWPVEEASAADGATAAEDGTTGGAGGGVAETVDPSGDPAFHEIATAPAHDRLDAYLSAWVAALEPEERMAFGTPPDDVIWVPRIG